MRTFFISFGDSARLELMKMPDVSQEGSPAQLGYAHIAFQTGSRKKVDELTARLKKDGYSVMSGPRTTGDGYYESSVYDANGNVIEITE